MLQNQPKTLLARQNILEMLQHRYNLIPLLSTFSSAIWTFSLHLPHDYTTHPHTPHNHTIYMEGQHLFRVFIFKHCAASKVPPTTHHSKVKKPRGPSMNSTKLSGMPNKSSKTNGCFNLIKLMPVGCGRA